MDFERELLILELEEEWQEYQQEQEKYYSSKPRWYQIVIGHVKPVSRGELMEAFGIFCENAGIRQPIHIFGSSGVRDFAIKMQALKNL